MAEETSLDPAHALDWDEEEAFRREVRPLVERLEEACKRHALNMAVLVEFKRDGGSVYQSATATMDTENAGPILRQVYALVEELRKHGERIEAMEVAG